MNVRQLGANRTEIEIDDLTVLISYETPVLYHVSGQAPRITNRNYSRTTSKHITQWLSANDFDRAKCATASPDAIAAILANGRAG